MHLVYQLQRLYLTDVLLYIIWTYTTTDSMGKHVLHTLQACELQCTLWDLEFAVPLAHGLWFLMPGAFRPRSLQVQVQEFDFSNFSGATLENKSGVLAAARKLMRLAGPGFHLTGAL